MKSGGGGKQGGEARGDVVQGTGRLQKLEATNKATKKEPSIGAWRLQNGAGGKKEKVRSDEFASLETNNLKEYQLRSCWY